MWVKCVLVWNSQPLTSIFGLVNSSIKKMRLECRLHPSHSMVLSLLLFIKKITKESLLTLWSWDSYTILQIFYIFLPFLISRVKWAIQTGELEIKMIDQVRRMAFLATGIVLKVNDETGNTTARNLEDKILEIRVRIEKRPS